MRAWSAVLLLLLTFAGTAPGKVPETVFAVPALTSTPLNPKTLSAAEKGGIITEEVTFHSETDGPRSVDIFAYFSYPKGARQLPAFIWNQGGLAQATPYWTEFGARRGYAALCIDFPLPGYRSTGAYPITSGLELGDDPRQAPIYHGAVALLKAVSYLQSRPEVDGERIGMAGSSWGGFYTTLMVGLDPRLRAGACLFGCGGLHLGNSWWDGQGPDARRSPAFRERWRTTLDPAWRLPNTKTPIAWFTGTNDSFFWLPALMNSYSRAAGPKHLSLLPNWNHALTAPLDEQVFAWLDVQLKGKPGFLEVSPVTVSRQGRPRARWTFAGPRRAVAAELLLSCGDAGNWSGRYWKTLRADLRDQACTADLPASAVPYYVSGTVLDADGFRYSTPVLRVDPAALGLCEPGVLPNYDGCSEWGGFEEDQIPYIKRHGLPVPALSPDAREGKESALLPAGTTTLPPVLGMTGWKHHFSCFVKADRPLELMLRLGGRFDGRPVLEEKSFRVGTGWTEIGLDFSPPAALAGGFQVTVIVPPGASVRLDEAHYRPVTTGHP